MPKHSPWPFLPNQRLPDPQPSVYGNCILLVVLTQNLSAAHDTAFLLFTITAWPVRSVLKIYFQNAFRIQPLLQNPLPNCTPSHISGLNFTTDSWSFPQLCSWPLSSAQQPRWSGSRSRSLRQEPKSSVTQKLGLTWLSISIVALFSAIYLLILFQPHCSLKYFKSIPAPGPLHMLFFLCYSSFPRSPYGQLSHFPSFKCHFCQEATFFFSRPVSLILVPTSIFFKLLILYFFQKYLTSTPYCIFNLVFYCKSIYLVYGPL